MNKLIGILKTLIAGYIITIALLIIISICMYKMSLSNNIISICITAAYGEYSMVLYTSAFYVLSLLPLIRVLALILLLLQNVLAYAVPAAVLVAFFPHR